MVPPISSTAQDSTGGVCLLPSSPESMTSLCNGQKTPHCGLETESWAACLGVGAKSSPISKGPVWPQIKQSAGDAGSGSEGQPSPCGLAEEEVIVQTGSGPGAQLTLDFPRQGWGS